MSFRPASVDNVVALFPGTANTLDRAIAAGFDPDTIVSEKSRRYIDRIMATSGVNAPIIPGISIPIHATYVSKFWQTWNRLASKPGRQTLLLQSLPADDATIIQHMQSYVGNDVIREFVRAVMHEMADRPLEAAVEASTGQPGFALFEDKIDYIQQILLALEDKTVEHISFEGETQSGKTIIMVMTLILRSARMAQHLSKLSPEEQLANFEPSIILNPVRNNPAEQTLTDFSGAERLHGPLQFADADYPISVMLGTYRAILLQAAGPHRQEMVKKGATGLNDLRAMFAEMSLHGVSRVCFLLDEADEATQMGSILAKIRDLGAEYRIKVRLVLFSATCYAYQWLKKYRRIRAVFSKDSPYSGTVQGGQLTPVDSMREAELKWGLHFLSAVRPSLYEDALKFFELRNYAYARRNGLKGTAKPSIKALYSSMTAAARAEIALMMGNQGHADYRTKCGETVLRLFEMLSTNKDANGEILTRHGPFNGGKGAMIRFGTDWATKHLFETISEKLETQFDVKVIRTGVKADAEEEREFKASLAGLSKDECDLRITRRKREMSQPGVSALVKKINTALTTNKHYCVTVLGMGRRADRFPTHTTIFCDFTEDFSTITAAEQGTLGRASGWNKITNKQSTLVLLSEKNANLVGGFRYLYKQYGIKIPTKTAGGGAVRLDDVQVTLRPSKRWDIDMMDKNESVQQLRNAIDSYIVPLLDVGRDEDGTVTRIFWRRADQLKQIGGCKFEDGETIPLVPFFGPDLLNRAIQDRIESFFTSEEAKAMGKLSILRPENTDWVRVSVGNARLREKFEEQQVRVNANDPDKAIRDFVAAVGAETDKFITDKFGAEFKTRKISHGERVAPLLSLMAEHKIVERLEARIDSPKIARPKVLTVLDDATGEFLDYVPNNAPDGHVAFVFRTDEKAGGANGRGMGDHDGQNRLIGLRLQVTYRKFRHDGTLIEVTKADRETEKSRLERQRELERTTAGEWKITAVWLPRADAILNDRRRKRFAQYRDDQPELLFTVDETGQPRVRRVIVSLEQEVDFFRDNIQEIGKYVGTRPSDRSLFSRDLTAEDLERFAEANACIEGSPDAII